MRIAEMGQLICFFQDRNLIAIQTNAHHLLRYLATTDVVNKRRMLKELIKITQQEHNSYKDHIIEFLECLYVNNDFEFAPTLGTGQLLGLNVGSAVEVTNCFPLPTGTDDDEADANGANYQLQMTKCLRKLNIYHMEHVTALVLAGGNVAVGRQRANMVVGIQLVYQWGAAAFQLIHIHHLDTEPIETIVGQYCLFPWFNITVHDSVNLLSFRSAMSIQENPNASINLPQLAKIL
jgi:hypothetical protein